MDEKDLLAIQANIDKKRLEIEQEIESKKKQVENDLAVRRAEMEQKLSDQRAEMERRQQEQMRLIQRQINTRELVAKIEAEFLAGKETIEAKVKEEEKPVVIPESLTSDADALMERANSAKLLRIENAVEKGVTEAKEKRPVFPYKREEIQPEVTENVPVREDTRDEIGISQNKSGILKFVKEIFHKDTPEEIAQDIAQKDAERIAEEERKKAEEESRRAEEEFRLRKEEERRKLEEERRRAEEEERRKAEEDRRRAEEERRKAEEEFRLRKEEERRKHEEEKRRVEEERRKAEEDRRRAEEERRRAEEEFRLRKEREEAERREAAILAKERELREEAERRAREKAEKEAQERAKQERLAREKAVQEEHERLERERAEKERLAKAEAEREQRRKLEQERLQKLKEEREQLAREKAELEEKKREKNKQNNFFRKNEDEQTDATAIGDERASSPGGDDVMRKKKGVSVYIQIVLFLMAAIILALISFYGTVFVMKHVVGAVDVGVVYPRTKVSSESGEIIEGVLTERINVLIMGTDYGDSEADKSEPKRTDAMIVLSVDPKKDKVAVLSIPRDTKVILSGHRDPQKINAAYAFGGVMLAKQTVANLLGVPITHYALANWQAFSEIVDLIGGVDLLVEQDMKYDDPYADLHIDIKKGYQHLDGKLAAQYVRFRSDELGDIGRTQRQQLFVRAAVKQMFSVGNIVKIPSILKTVSDYVETDMTFVTMMKVMNSVKLFGEKNIRTGTLGGENLEEDGVSYWQTSDEAIVKVLKELEIPSSKLK